MDLGPRIAAWMNVRVLNQKQVAEALGVSRGAVCMWVGKSGTYRRPPSTANLHALVDLFGITMERFYGPIPKIRKRAA